MESVERHCSWLPGWLTRRRSQRHGMPQGGGASNRPAPDFGRRTREALFCREPDRVPLLEIGADQLVKEAFLGRPMRNLHDDVEFWFRAGYDCVPVFIDMLPGIKQLLQRGKLRKGKTASEYKSGEEDRLWVQSSESMIASWKDFETFPWGKPEDADFSSLDTLNRILRHEGMKALAVFGGVFDSTVWILGYERFCYQSVDNPDLVEAIERRLGEFIYGVFAIAADYDCVGGLWYADDLGYGAGLRVNPSHLRENVFPWMRKIGDLCKDRDLPYLFHTDGDVTEVLDDIIESGVSALHPIEPKAMDIAALKKRVGNRLCLIGNIDLGSTLTRGTPAMVEEEVRQRIHECAPGGGYCVGSSNCVTNYVPLDNYKAMIDATFKYGTYPIGC